ncbi:MAG: MFS transporter [Candidatus Marinimicrobia bacterium]|nr:MFS transporter [Candidatus Neomarinimicrobiota bacterium]
MNRQGKIILAITGLSHMLAHAMMLIYPTLMVVIRDELNLGFDALGFIALASSFMFGLGAIPAGYFENRVGGRKLLLLFQFSCIPAGIMVALSNSVASFTAGLVVVGLAASVYHPAGLTLLSRRVRPMGRAMAIHGILGSIGLALGPLLATAFAEYGSWRNAYLVIPVVGGLLGLATMLLVPSNPSVEEQKVDQDISPAKTNKSALAFFYITALLMGLAYNGFTTFMPSHFAENTGNFMRMLSENLRAGFFPSLVFIAGIAGQWIGGILADKYSRSVLLVWVVFLNIPFLLLMGISSDHLLVTWSLMLGIVHFNFQPIANTLISELTHSDNRGLGFGINFFLTFGVGAVSAGLSGMIAQQFGIVYVFPTMGLILIPAVLSGLMVIKKSRVSS